MSQPYSMPSVRYSCNRHHIVMMHNQHHHIVMMHSLHQHIVMKHNQHMRNTSRIHRSLHVPSRSLMLTSSSCWSPTSIHVLARCACACLCICLHAHAHRVYAGCDTYQRLGTWCCATHDRCAAGNEPSYEPRALHVR